MRVLVSGGNGFIARNLRVRLGELGHRDVQLATRDTSVEELRRLVGGVDFVFHLAGVNRPLDEQEFAPGNLGTTQLLCQALASTGRAVPVVYASSTQALLDNPYGRSKKGAEDALLQYGRESGAPVYLYRLTNVFGKWARPNYNSAVATFCHQVTHGLPLTVNDPAARLRLLYIDDVVESMARMLEQRGPAGFVEVEPVYQTTVGEVAGLLQEFARSRASLAIGRVGSGLVRALYSTFVSHLPPAAFAYSSPVHGDARGEFVEMLKTPDCGQFSYFTAHPGVTRGGHYHHSKTEKFLVIRGTAHFGFRNIESNDRHEMTVRGGEGRIVETAPGWTHDITNIGEEELVVMLWANEVFDRSRPDTIPMKVAE